LSQGKALVTGSTGLIGLAVTRQLLRDGWDVVGVDRRPPPRGDGSLDGLRALECPLDALTAGHLEGVDAVVHLAAMTLEASANRARELVAANVTATDRLFALATEAGARVVCYASSQAVYGPPAVYERWAGAGVGEDAPLRPRSLYAHSKLLGEGLASFYAGPARTVFVGFRPPLCYGIDRLDGVSGKFARFVLDAVDGRPATLGAPFGRHGHLQLIYVKDMAAAFARALMVEWAAVLPGEPHVVLHAPTRERLRVEDAVRIVAQATGNPGLSVPEAACDAAIQAPWMRPDRAFDLLGVEQRYPLAAAVADLALCAAADRPRGGSLLMRQAKRSRP
jgi:nucleoside-diphosphate-sugar epimerase